MLRFIAVAAFGAAVRCQQVSTLTPEVHPSFSWKTCTSGKQCTAQSGKLTLDSNFRGVFKVNSTEYCFQGNMWSMMLCPDDVTCTKNCALNGEDVYAYDGVASSSGELRLTYPSPGGPYGGNQDGSRLFLMADDTHYQTFNLLNKEFAFDVDVSRVPCGMNAALYFVKMDADGGMAKYPTNVAGAKYGTGYCDAKCPRTPLFINGQANVNGWEPSSVAASGPASGTGMYGSCCAEVDIWAANYASTALIALPCSNPSQTICTGSSCSSTCDPSGCAFNPYQMGNTTFYGSGQTIDTAQKFTVVTQFLTTDGTSTGTLSEIKRFYIQNGITYQNPESNIASVEGNSLTSTFCAAQKTAFIADVNAAQFEAQGGLSSISKALAGGMVLTFSYWDDKGDDLSWLDGIYPLGADVTTPGVRRGPCLGQDASLPVTELATSSVYFSNVRFGEIGSTV